MPRDGPTFEQQPVPVLVEVKKQRRLVFEQVGQERAVGQEGLAAIGRMVPCEQAHFRRLARINRRAELAVQVRPTGQRVRIGIAHRKAHCLIAAPVGLDQDLRPIRLEGGVLLGVHT